MLLAILITVIAVSTLFVLSSFRYHRRGTILISIITGVYVIHSAHKIFDGLAPANGEHALLVDAVFTLVYLPVVYLILFRSLSRWFGIVENVLVPAVTLGLALTIYFFFFIEPSRSWHNYANLLWHAEIVSLVMFAQRVWHVASKDEVKNYPSRRSYFVIVKTWLALLLTPYAVSLISYFVPADNFIFSYVPLFPKEIVSSAASVILLLIMITRVYRFKTAFESKISRTTQSKLTI